MNFLTTERQRIRFSVLDDIALLKEVINLNPFHYKNQWGNIAENLNSGNLEGKVFTSRCVRDRTYHLLRTFMRKETVKRRVPGKEEEYTVLTVLLEDAVALVQEFGGLKQQEPKGVKQEEFGGVKQQDFEGVKQPVKTSCHGNESGQFLNFIREKQEEDRELKREELELEEKRLALEERKLRLEEDKFTFQKLQYETEAEERRKKFEVELEERKQNQEILMLLVKNALEKK